MLKSLLAVMIFILIAFSRFIVAQDSNSIQVNGGIIMPMSSSKGLSASVQYNYSISQSIQLYVNSGYAKWDQYNVIFHEERSTIQKQEYFRSYIADDHTLLPIYLGGRINFNTNKFFTGFVNFEIGYSHLTYNSYSIIKLVDLESGEVLDYYPDSATKIRHSEHLFGFGIGAGLSHPITRNLNLILAFKLNSYVNNRYSGILSTRGTYTMFNMGFSFNI